MMKSLFALLILTVCAQAQQPLQFHGVSLGQPASAFIDCSSGKLLDKRFHGGFGNKASKEICAGGANHIVVGSKNVGGFGHVVFDEDLAYFDHGKLVSIGLSMHKETFDNVVADMTAKLGRKPDATDPKVLQNAFGAQWSFGKAVWSGDVAVTVEESVGGSVPPTVDGIVVTIVDSKSIPTEQRVSSLDGSR